MSDDIAGRRVTLGDHLSKARGLAESLCDQARVLLEGTQGPTPPKETESLQSGNLLEDAAVVCILLERASRDLVELHQIQLPPPIEKSA